MQNNDEELLKWAKSMKNWQRVLVDSARFAAWHNVRNPLHSWLVAAHFHHSFIILPCSILHCLGPPCIA